MRIASKIIIPILIVVAGAAGAYLLIHAKPKTKRVPPPPRVPLVEVIEAAPTDAPALVEANGEVVPSESVTIVPQVGGRIVFRSENLIPGGRLKKGDLIARIDPREFELAIRQQESVVRQAKLELQLEESRKQVAEREWELLGDGRSRDESALALRGPQLETAKENVEAAQSALDRAQLNLDRAEIRAPFNALVVSASIDVGQVVSPGSPAAAIIGTDRYWVRASIPVERLPLIDVPGYNAGSGSGVTVIQDLGQTERVVRSGTVVGLAGGLDTATRTAQLLVAVDDPLDPPDGERPLLHGAFVSLEIRGRSLAGACRLPGTSLVDGAVVWVVGDENRMESRAVRVVWTDRESVFVTDGIIAGDRVIVTPLSLPVEGAKVRLRNDAQAPDGDAEPPAGKEASDV